MNARNEHAHRIGRRELPFTAATAALGLEVAHAQERTSPMAGEIPIYTPRTEFVYEAIIAVRIHVPIAACARFRACRSLLRPIVAGSTARFTWTRRTWCRDALRC